MTDHGYGETNRSFGRLVLLALALAPIACALAV